MTFNDFILTALNRKTYNMAGLSFDLSGNIILVLKLKEPLLQLDYTSIITAIRGNEMHTAASYYQEYWLL